MTTGRICTRRALGGLLLALTLWPGLGCGGGDAGDSAGAADRPAGWPAELRFGLLPTEQSTTASERWAGLLAHIEQEVGLPVRPYTATDYAAVILAMQYGNIELAYFGPNSYVEAEERANARALVSERQADGSEGYRGLLISKADGGPQALDQLAGRSFAFVDPNSTSGYLVPMLYFRGELSVVPEEYFSRVIMSGSHEATILAVRNGHVDAGATNTIDLGRAREAGRVTDEELTVLWESPPIPGAAIAARGDLPEDLQQALQRALVSFADPAQLERLNSGGFLAADTGTYAPVHRMRALKAELEGG